MTHKSLLPLLAAVIVMPAAALAQTVYEGFEFTGTVAGSGSGTGWFSGANWTVSTAATSTNFQIGTGSLTVGSLTTSGGHAVSSFNGLNIMSRRMASAAPSSGDFWVSIVVDANTFAGGVTFSNNSNSNLHLTSTVFADRARFGFGINGANFYYILDGRETNFISASVSNGGINTAQNSPSTLLVAKFDVTNGTFSMWANPSVGGTTPTGGVQVANNVSFVRKGATFAGDVTHVALFANWGNVQLDELRIGSSFAAVAIPEPSAFAALAGLAGLGLAAARRRRRA